MSGADVRAHLDRLAAPLAALEHEAGRLERWADLAVAAFGHGGRLLACGNGGSAAHAQHLTAELVGRYLDERAPVSALALHADTSALTAIANDYGATSSFSRPVRAHGRPGDLLVALSTSGTSANVVAAIGTANELGLTTLALTGRAPNPCAMSASDRLVVDTDDTATVQEVHQVAIHLLCAAIDRRLVGHDAVVDARG